MEQLSYYPYRNGALMSVLNHFVYLFGELDFTVYAYTHTPANSGGGRGWKGMCWRKQQP